MAQQLRKNPPVNAGATGDLSSISGSGRSPGGNNGNLLQYSLPRKFHGQRNLAGYSPWGHKESDTTQWPSMCTYVHFLSEFLSAGANGGVFPFLFTYGKGCKLVTGVDTSQNCFVSCLNSELMLKIEWPNKMLPFELFAIPFVSGRSQAAAFLLCKN